MKSITLILSYGTKAIIETVMKNNSFATGTKALNLMINSYEEMKKNDDRQKINITTLLRENQELKAVIKHLRFMEN